jgi:sphingolipid delta-4 desaturase
MASATVVASVAIVTVIAATVIAIVTVIEAPGPTAPRSHGRSTARSPSTRPGLSMARARRPAIRRHFGHPIFSTVMINLPGQARDRMNRKVLLMSRARRPVPRSAAGAGAGGEAEEGTTMADSRFIHVDYPEPHIGRTRKMLTAHPELRTLFGPHSGTIVWTVLIVALQVWIAAMSAHLPIWAILLIAYTVGAVANHACFVIVHEATHNLIFASPTANRWAGILANVPIFFPSAISFRKYHLLHHRWQGNMDYDADLSSPWEARLVGSGAFMKSMWLLFFFIFEGIVRPARLKNVKFIDGWTITNNIVQFAILGLMFYLWGPWTWFYLFCSVAFSIGLHPLGARWIQEHYVFKDGQETYSYYGPANKITFNVGYHNEHHDLIMVAWPNLPRIKAMAPEFYDSLMSHQSWTGLLFKFLFDRNTTLFSRVTRDIGPAAPKTSPERTPIGATEAAAQA